MTMTVCPRRRLICSVIRFPILSMRITAVGPQSHPEVSTPMLHSCVLAWSVWHTSSRHRVRTIPVPLATEVRSIGWIGAAMRAVAVATIDVTGYQAASLIRSVLRDRTTQVSASTVT